MIRKISGTMVTATLMFGLAACNTNNTNDINDQTMDQVGMNTTDVRNGMTDVARYGPFTDRYNTNNDNDLNLFTGKIKNKLNNDDMISAYQTTMDSSQYPHTRAVLIKDAKYQFVTMDPAQVNQFRSKIIQHLQPNAQQQQMQMPKTPTEKQTQPVPEQPEQAPQKTQPAPQKTQPAPKPSQPAPAPTQTQKNTGAAGSISQFVQQVIDLTNEQRSKNGLPALKADTQLNGVAQKKADDMQQNHYFSHTSPTYGSPFDMMRDFGVTYKAAGENIAQGQKTPQEVVTAWMNSEGHRANILSSKYTHIGVGFEGTGNHWSQMFIGK